MDITIIIPLDLFVLLLMGLPIAFSLAGSGLLGLFMLEGTRSMAGKRVFTTVQLWAGKILDP